MWGEKVWCHNNRLLLRPFIMGRGNPCSLTAVYTWKCVSRGMKLWRVCANFVFCNAVMQGGFSIYWFSWCHESPSAASLHLVHFNQHLTCANMLVNKSVLNQAVWLWNVLSLRSGKKKNCNFITSKKTGYLGLNCHESKQTTPSGLWKNHRHRLFCHGLTPNCLLSY